MGFKHLTANFIHFPSLVDQHSLCLSWLRACLGDTALQISLANPCWRCIYSAVHTEKSSASKHSPILASHRLGLHGQQLTLVHPALFLANLQVPHCCKKGSEQTEFGKNAMRWFMKWWFSATQKACDIIYITTQIGMIENTNISHDVSPGIRESNGGWPYLRVYPTISDHCRHGRYIAFRLIEAKRCSYAKWLGTDITREKKFAGSI